MKAIGLREVQSLLHVTARIWKRHGSTLTVWSTGQLMPPITSKWATLSTTLLGNPTNPPIMQCFGLTVYHIWICYLCFHLKMCSHTILLQFQVNVYPTVTAKALRQGFYVIASPHTHSSIPLPHMNHREASHITKVLAFPNLLSRHCFSIMILFFSSFYAVSVDLVLESWRVFGNLIARCLFILTSFEDPSRSTHWVNVVCSGSQIVTSHLLAGSGPRHHNPVDPHTQTQPHRLLSHLSK